MALSILRRYAPHFVVLGLLAFLWWRYSSVVEEAGRLEAANSHLFAANQASTETIEQLTGEIARRERVHREIQSDLAELRTHRQTLKDQLIKVNDDAPEVFRDCLAVSLPAEYISLRIPAKAD